MLEVRSESGAGEISLIGSRIRNISVKTGV